MIESFVDFISCNVYKWNLGDCTNGGISGRYNDLYLCRDYVTPEDVIEYCKEKGEDPERFVITERRHLFGKEYLNIRQVCHRTVNNRVLGGMSGGNFLYSCDSRWKEITGCDYPLSIHDRYESQEEYDILSR